MTRSIGAYSVDEELPGEGEAFLVSSSDGKACTLRLLAKHEDADGWEDAERETKIGGQLVHPAVNGALETFWHDGKLAVVFPSHEGANVAQLLTKLGQLGESLDSKAIAFVGEQVAGALEQAHSATDENDDFVRVCHGHLSPSQITIAWDGQVRVEGLGLASLVGVAGVKGVDGYVPPEQRGGGRITPRGDIYSLAAVVWALCAGKEPGAEQTLTVAELGDSVPEPLREPLQRALETSLGKRKITSMELEQWFGEGGASAEGKAALAAAVEPLRKGTNLTGSKSTRPEIKTRPLGGKIDGAKPKPPVRLPPRRPAIPGGKKLPPLGSKKAKLPPLRSKQRTLLGYSSEAGEDEGLSALETPSPPLAKGVDWKTARESTSGPSDPDSALGGIEVDDELSWDAEKRRSSKPSPPTSSEPSPTEPDKDPDLAAFDRAVDDAVESLSALQEPPSRLEEPLSPPSAPPEEEEGSPLADLSVLDEEPPPSGSTPPPDLDLPPELSAAVIDPPDRSIIDTLASETEPSDPVAVEAVAEQAPPVEPAPPEEASDDAAAEDVESPQESTVDGPPTDDAHSNEVASPWGEVVPPKKKPISMLKAIALTFIVACIVMAIGVWLSQSQDDQPLPGPSASPSLATAGPTRPKRTIKPLASIAPSTKSGSASGATTMSSSASAASASASAAPTAAASAGGDGSNLPPTKGYLIVSFNGEQGGQVYFYTRAIGPVGAKLEVACEKPTFVRIGKLPGPRWLSQGRPLRVACQSVTEVAMKP